MLFSYPQVTNSSPKIFERASQSMRLSYSWVLIYIWSAFVSQRQTVRQLNQGRQRDGEWKKETEDVFLRGWE